jgi:FkbM family methyltransferase
MTDDTPLSITKFCRPGTVIDAGANLGLYSKALLRLQDCRVVAFEPVRETFLELCKRIAEMNDGYIPDRFTPYNLALGAEATTATIVMPVVQRTAFHEWASLAKDFGQIAERAGVKNVSTIRQDVVVIPLDTFCSLHWFQPVTFMKIDVEGTEIEVLQGAKEIIEASKPVIFIEIEERHRSGSTTHVPDFLFAQGYRGFFWHKGKIGDIDRFDPKTMQCAGLLPTDEINSDLYINEFLFIHHDDTWALSQLAHFGHMS